MSNEVKVYSSNFEEVMKHPIVMDAVAASVNGVCIMPSNLNAIDFKTRLSMFQECNNNLKNNSTIKNKM